MRSLLDWLSARLPKRIIMDHTNPDVEYMHRMYLLGGSRGPDGELVHRRWELCLHKIMVSDSDWLHNHSAAYFSCILAGSYREHTPDGVFLRRPGHMRVRGRNSYHRLEIVDGPVYTLFAFLNRDLEDGEWGFLVNGVHVPHQAHLGENQ